MAAGRTRAQLVGDVLASDEFDRGIRPRLDALRNVVVPPSGDIAVFPGSAPEFVNTLYSCVLNVDHPDDEGFANWMQHLRGGTPMSTIYPAFFRYLEASVSDDRFARKLYGCILFRAPEPGAERNVLRSLAAGRTRAQLVRDFVASAEFKERIEPRLNALRTISSLNASSSSRKAPSLTRTRPTPAPAPTRTPVRASSATPSPASSAGLRAGTAR
jgi:hypothetical protein